MPDRNVETLEFALKNSFYQTNDQTIVIGDLSRIQQSFVIQFDDVQNFTNFDGDPFSIETLIAFLRKNTAIR